jgi:orotidine-5'-phosphate decarboxylase
VTDGARTAFADRLAALVEERRSQLCLGLDPDPAKLWPGSVHPGREAVDASEVALLTASAVTSHCIRAIDAAGPSCVAVKPQLACFERLGAVGWGALEAVVAAAQDAGLLVVADGKRGDVPVTARAYAQALVGETPGPFGPVPGLGADAFTANPLLGRDALEPLTDSGAGVFVLVRTSNPGAAEVQDEPADAPLHERLARLVDAIGSDHVGACGLSSIGAVTGATRPDLLQRLRDLMPRAIFLLPGVGAQGGAVDDLAPAFAPHPAAGLITASRSIVNAYEKAGGEPARAAAEAAEELRKAAWRHATS